jgi:hypothetical protein
MALSWWSSHAAVLLSAVPALMWLIPDRRIERVVSSGEH